VSAHTHTLVELAICVNTYTHITAVMIYAAAAVVVVRALYFVKMSRISLIHLECLEKVRYLGVVLVRIVGRGIVGRCLNRKKSKQNQLMD